MNPNVPLSTYSIVVMLLSMTLGLLTAAQNSGKFLGQWTVPAAAMVWIVIAVPFLGGVSASLATATAITPSSILVAVVTGIGDIVAGAAPSAVVHGAVAAHLVLPHAMRALRLKYAPPANTNAAPAAPKAAA